MELKDFLTTLHDMLTEGEMLQFQVTRKGDSLNLAFIPKLDSKNDNKAETADIRAALSMPLVFNNMTLDGIEIGLIERLKGFGQARNSAKTAYDELLASLNDATAKAKNGKAKAAGEKTGSKATDRKKAAQDASATKPGKSAPASAKDDPEKADSSGVLVF